MKVQTFIKENKAFCLFASLAVLIVLTAIFAPVVTGGVSPTDAVLGDALQAPSAEHLFGTDKLGRDVFARVIYGSRTSLAASFSVVLIIFTLGTALGILSGYFGGWVDAAIMRVADMMVSFPGMVFAMAIAGILGASVKNAVVAVALVSWTKYARLARSLVLKTRSRDYVAAAVVTGSKTPYLLTRYLLPDVLPMLLVTAAADIGGMMLELAGLSFLGFGAKAPTPEWGLMLNEGRQFIQNAPWMTVYPGAAIFVVAAVFNLLGDALRDMLDPRDE
ncbi:MAG: ABC transporter permease [Clostridiaceae bacterium]|nr:ABC transporter permease [Clostridiaceae bacterium]MCI9484346.1 ABC transporter permease [Clostridiaceae bacterium]NBH76759.1 ABC transporter permease [Clostridiaceae bacterium]NBI82421.1 ABC transporter permease [Clostridiaceae bacterium]